MVSRFVGFGVAGPQQVRARLAKRISRVLYRSLVECFVVGTAWVLCVSGGVLVLSDNLMADRS